MDTYTYTSDMNRPECPDCGLSVEQYVPDPQIPWQGKCANNHLHTYQLEEEEEEEEEDYL